ncbi:hypothetical protein M569_00876 [Genlisea aurea]|uniref:Clp R domain-containing protein n=1 Tax=Genlisea aurea TaxID=192259 RepID=S8D921_9LAMI|nr:hypothetical protein M569_00876 [Genlisea aurea]
MAAQGLSVISKTPYFSTNREAFRKPVKQQLISQNLSNSFFGTKVSIPPVGFSVIGSIRSCSTVAAITLSLPTTKTEIVSDKNLKWSSRSIKSFAMAELEARKLKFPNTGTEALLMGILIEGTSLAARFLRENGVTLFKVREETVNLLGKSDLFFFSPEHPPLTEPAQNALDYAVEEKLKSGEDGEITTAHLLLGIWSQNESAGYKIMVTLGINDDKLSELAKNKDKDIILSFK